MVYYSTQPNYYGEQESYGELISLSAFFTQRS